MSYSTSVRSFDSVTYYNDAKQFHREDGPAIEYDCGDRQWCINGEAHRDGGPAIEFFRRDYEDIHHECYRDGGWTFYYHWFVNGLRHREDGPAVEYMVYDDYGIELIAISKWYYIFNNPIPEKEFTPELILELKMNRIIET